MTEPLRTYASVPNLLIHWFATVRDSLPVSVPERSVSTDLPSDYAAHLPFVRLNRVGGPRSLGIDTARVRVEVFASSYDDAERLANTLDGLIEFHLNGHSDGNGTVIKTGVQSGMSWTQWLDENVERFMGTYTIHVAALR